VFLKEVFVSLRTSFNAGSVPMASDLGRIQSYLRQQARRGRIAEALTAFTVYAPASDDGVEDAYAIPHRLASALRDVDLDELLATFRRRGARPQVEFIANLYPDLPACLEAAGYEETQRQPVLIAHEVHAPPAPPHAEIVEITRTSPLEVVRENLDTNARGFGEEAGASEQEAQEFRAGLVTSRAFTMRVDGRAVTAGMFEAIRGGVTELMGIATLPEYRRRGFAGYLTAVMAERAFAHGATLIFLCAASEEARRVYERIGFCPCATLVEYARP
jgi:ribosomal protein S18 acetylase RimI-like enzyme